MTAKIIDDVFLNSVPEIATIYRGLDCGLGENARPTCGKALFDTVAYCLFNCPILETRLCLKRKYYISFRVRLVAGAHLVTIHLPTSNFKKKRGDYGSMSTRPTIFEYDDGTIKEGKWENGHKALFGDLWEKAIKAFDQDELRKITWKMPTNDEIKAGFKSEYIDARLRDVREWLGNFNRLFQIATDNAVVCPLKVYVYRDPVGVRINTYATPTGFAPMYDKPENREWTYTVVRFDTIFHSAAQNYYPDATSAANAAKHGWAEREWTEDGKLHRDIIVEIIEDYPPCAALKAAFEQRYEKDFLQPERVVEYLEKHAERHSEEAYSARSMVMGGAGGLTGRVVGQRGWVFPPEMIEFYTKRSSKIRKGAKALREINEPRQWSMR